jgi:hypothetical protein
MPQILALPEENDPGPPSFVPFQKAQRGFVRRTRISDIIKVVFAAPIDLAASGIPQEGSRISYDSPSTSWGHREHVDLPRDISYPQRVLGSGTSGGSNSSNLAAQGIAGPSFGNFHYHDSVMFSSPALRDFPSGVYLVRGEFSFHRVNNVRTLLEVSGIEGGTQLFQGGVNQRSGNGDNTTVVVPFLRKFSIIALDGFREMRFKFHIQTSVSGTGHGIAVSASGIAELYGAAHFQRLKAL